MPDSALQLRDIHLPASPSFWPPAPGWWLLFAALLLLAFWAYRSWRQRRTLQRQRQAVMSLLDELSVPATRGEVPDFLARLSTLLRRMAVARYGQRRVAPLKGQGWLAFLDETLGDSSQAFTTGAGRMLADGPYRPAGDDATLLDAEETERLQRLLDLARRWMKQHTNSPAGGGGA